MQIALHFIWEFGFLFKILYRGFYVGLYIYYYWITELCSFYRWITRTDYNLQQYNSICDFTYINTKKEKKEESLTEKIKRFPDDGHTHKHAEDWLKRFDYRRCLSRSEEIKENTVKTAPRESLVKVPPDP